MNPNDIRIVRIYTEHAAALPPLTDDSVNAGVVGWDICIEWEAGSIQNALIPPLLLNYATRDIITNLLVPALTSGAPVALATNGAGVNTRYTHRIAIGVAALTAGHMYEVSACLWVGAIPIHSYVHSWVFVAY